MVGNDTEEEMRQQALRLFDAGDYVNAKPLLERLCVVEGVDPEIQGRLAFVLIQQGELKDAESLLRDAVASRSEDVQLVYWLAVVVAQQSRMAEAKELYESVLAKSPHLPEAHNDLGHVMRSLGDQESAEAHFRKAIAIKPDLIGPLYNLGLSCAQRGAFQEAEQWYRKVLGLAPDHVETLNNLANALRQMDKLDEAVALYRRAIQLKPDIAFAHANLAHTLENLHRLDEALDAAGKALQLEPTNPVAALVVAQVNRRNGALDIAQAQLEPLATAGLPPNHSAAINSELGQILDRAGDFGAAYEAWERSNQIWSEALGFGRVQDNSYLEYIDQVQRYFGVQDIGVWPKNVGDDERTSPIFLTGFPRSGTTLMEQMLGAHSEIYTSREVPVLSKLLNVMPELTGSSPTGYPHVLDEINEADVTQLRARYWKLADEAAKPLSGESRFVDKLPLNLVELGLVRRIFPEARVLVMLRDPRDVCLSAFSQAFQPNRAMIHFLSLERAAKLYSAAMELWLTYRSVLDIAYKEVRYEDLVEDANSVLRDVLGFLGSEWENSVMDFHATSKESYARTPSYQDVTTPIYRRSEGRWRNYGDQLAPVIPVLEKYITEFGYQQSSSGVNQMQ